MATGKLYKLSAFSDRSDGGNPAGVWIGDELPDGKEMLAIAADVGFSETAFVTPATGRERTVRYYSPEAEVSFCGHATIAAGAQLGRLDGAGRYSLATSVGDVEVEVDNASGQWVAALTSVTPRYEEPGADLLDRALSALGWDRGELDSALPPAKAYAGAWHLVLAVREQARLQRLDYDFGRLKALMLENDLTTLQLVWRESDEVIHSRNPFPVGGVVEDPATGAAAAALGGYLRDSGRLTAPATFLIRQGEDMGRPSRIEVELPASGGIVVRGTAVQLDR